MAREIDIQERRVRDIEVRRASGVVLCTTQRYVLRSGAAPRPSAVGSVTCRTSEPSSVTISRPVVFMSSRPHAFSLRAANSAGSVARRQS